MKMGEKKLTCRDLFCGCGGLSKGFQLAGFNIVGGIDFNIPAVATYAKNFPDAQAVCCDLMDMDPESISREFPYECIDVVIGGPPCQGFSTANRYVDEERRDPRNKLFFQFVKFVDLFSPKAVVIENVRGILTMNKGYAKRRIESIFKGHGYSVVNCVLNAADYGVPQRRFRNFFVMLKEGKFSFDSLSKVEHCPTVQEAIGELYSHEKDVATEVTLATRPKTDYQKYLRDGQKSVLNHEVRYPAKKVQDRIACVPQGGNWQDVPAEMWPTNRNNRHSSAYKRLKEDDQSVTIDTGNNHSNYFHPLYNRLPTVREAARLQSFPDSFVFLGNRSEQYRQVGNAVPPLLAKAIADEIMRIL
jgi:DNA (cytosine-5)-methyltransferase 1